MAIKNLLESPITLEVAASAIINYEFQRPVLLVGLLISSGNDANQVAPGIDNYQAFKVAQPSTGSGVLEGIIYAGNVTAGSPVYLNFQPDGLIIQNVSFESLLTTGYCVMFYKQLEQYRS